ncbi:MAG: hypothetical protein K2H46_03920 [Muribaculaceae bacterium]|nr:hypothetical protein [Muribaculaceae bacterium]
MNNIIDFVEMFNILFNGGNYRIPVKRLVTVKQAVKAKWGFYPTVVMDDGEFAIIKL